MPDQRISAEVSDHDHADCVACFIYEAQGTTPPLHGYVVGGRAKVRAAIARYEAAR